MKGMSTFKIVISALFAALICVATMLIQIHIPATGGYANLCDGVILICAFLMYPIYAVIAAGLGSFLADVLSGYAGYAAGTLVIKAGVALIAAGLYRRFAKEASPRAKLAVMIVAGVLAEVFMVLGYFFYEAVLLGEGGGAAGGIIGNIAQAAVGIVIACIVAPVLARSHEVTEMMNKL